MKKILPVIPVLLLVVTIASLVLYPTATPIFGTISLLFSLASSIYAIFQTHAGTESPRAKIIKETGILVLTLIVIIFLGGIVATLVNYQTSLRWGQVVGILSALGASFVVGYVIRKGMMRLTG